MPFSCGFRRPKGGSTLLISCSAEINPACAKVLPAAKRLYGAKTPRPGRAVGWYLRRNRPLPKLSRRPRYFEAFGLICCDSISPARRRREGPTPRHPGPCTAPAAAPAFPCGTGDAPSAGEYQVPGLQRRRAGRRLFLPQAAKGKRQRVRQADGKMSDYRFTGGTLQLSRWI